MNQKKFVMKVIMEIINVDGSNQMTTHLFVHLDVDI